MLKYLNFHNSSFALRYLFSVNGQGHSVTHPLFKIAKGGVLNTIMIMIMIIMQRGWWKTPDGYSEDTPLTNVMLKGAHSEAL
jgi:hypothetical protein